jgi:hypothetical protein
LKIKSKKKTSPVIKHKQIVQACIILMVFLPMAQKISGGTSKVFKINELLFLR